VRSSDALSLALPLFLAFQCEPAEPDPFDCTLGLTTADGGFVPVTGDTRLELELGFQGFLLGHVAIRTTDDRVPDELEGAVSLTPDGLDPLGGPFARTALLDEPDGARVSEPIQVFFDASALADYIGRTATIAVRAEAGRFRCLVEGDVVLVDDDPCIHTGGEPICPDDEEGTGVEP
jgi:hypothetical protein